MGPVQIRQRWHHSSPVSVWLHTMQSGYPRRAALDLLIHVSRPPSNNTHNMPGQKFFDTIMAEHIRLPGCPQIVVTRGFAYQWLKGCGMNESARGIGSLDYMVFASSKTHESLTDLKDPNISQFLAQVQKELTQEFT